MKFPELDFLQRMQIVFGCHWADMDPCTRVVQLRSVAGGVSVSSEKGKVFFPSLYMPIISIRFVCEISLGC